MAPRVVIIGAGVGGTVVGNRLARRLRRGEATVLVVDAAARHLYQPGLLYLPFGIGDAEGLVRPARRLLHQRVELLTLLNRTYWATIPSGRF